MEVFILMGEIFNEGTDLLGVYASLEDARIAQGVYTRGLRYEIYDRYYVIRQTVGVAAGFDIDVVAEL